MILPLALLRKTERGEVKETEGEGGREGERKTEGEEEGGNFKDSTL